MASLPQANSLRILSIDGGGIKGYTALLIMKRIFHAIKVEAKKEGIELTDEPRPCDVFDLIVGTSTGGLIAVMLGRLHMTIDECIQQYENLSSRLFGKWQLGGQPGRLVKGMLNSAFYDIGALQTEIKSVLKLQKIAVDEDFKENAPVCKTIVCVTRSKTAAPDVLRNYESEHSTQTDHKCTIWEAASATAAAPMFFKAVTFKAGGEIWRDGGLRRNNPINVALAQLGFETEWKDKRIGCVLSLGTGAPKINEISDNLAKFLKGSVDMMTSSEDIADAFAISKDGQDLAKSQRYFRFSVAQGMEVLQMDEYKETERMKSLTDLYLSKIGNGTEVDQCAKSLLLPDQNCHEQIADKPELLPYRNCVHFVDRETYNAELHRFFGSKISGQRRFVLWGPGGSGKTQIALRYALSMRSKLSVFWVRADDFSNFLNDFSQIMYRLDPSQARGSTSQDRRLLARNVTARLEKDPSTWLLVLDNADNYDLFVETAGGREAISSYVPKDGRVLLTTRDRQFQGTVAAAKDGLHVKQMNMREARDLFEKSVTDDLAGQSTPAMVDELLDLVGNLPLALAQAAANIADQQRPVHEYVAAYRDKRQRMLLMERPFVDLETQDSRTSHQSVLVTYELSFQDLERDHQSSARCLNYFGFFHWQNIPEYCIRALPELKDLDDHSFRSTIKCLFHLSMIEQVINHDSTEYSVHPVIHERISERLSFEEKTSYLSNSIAVMVSKFPRFGRYGGHKDYALCRSLQSHALQQIHLAVDIGLKSQDLARLNDHCAVFLRRTGMTFDSVELAAQVVAIRKEIDGPRGLSTIDACNFKAVCLNSDARYREAYNESISAMEKLESTGSNNEPMDDIKYLKARVRILKTMSTACRSLGHFNAAEKIGIELVRLGTESPEESNYRLEHRLSDRIEVVKTLIRQGRFQEAKKMNNELLESMDELQRTVHRGTFSLLYGQKAVILSKIRKGSDTEPATVLADDEEKAILQIFKDLFNEDKATLLLTDRDLWIGCETLVRELEFKGETQKAARILVDMLTEAVESKLRIEGKMIRTFGHLVRTGLMVINSLHETRDARQGPPGLPIANLLVQITTLIDTTNKRLWRGSHPLYDLAALYMCVGGLSKAEDLSREALQDIKLETDRSIEGWIHYTLMLAIARQGRIGHARQYRDTHLALITGVESTRGDLESQLCLIREEKELYEKAKSIVAARKYKVSESWWTEHREALNRAQLMYGLLNPARAEEDSGSFADASHPVVPAEKKRDRKSRGLGVLVERFH